MNKFFNIQSQIQNIEIAEYTLKPKYSLNSKYKSSNHRPGFLLKINFKETGEGYSDCFSWEELGDFSLKDQILNLKNNEYNIHLKKSIYFSYIDSLYRAKKQNIFSEIYGTNSTLLFGIKPDSSMQFYEQRYDINSKIESSKKMNIKFYTNE